MGAAPGAWGAAGAAKGLVIDLFAGGGGASAGLEAALGRPVDIAINHDPIALAAHKANHPHTRHLEADIWEVRPLDATGGRPVSVLWASPDCTHFSVAKGGKPRKQGIRSLAWAVVRWAAAVRPEVIFLENVSEFRGWGPLGVDGRPDKARMGETFRRWRRKLERLGYVVDYRVLDASHYGTPTRRRRLFLVARRDGLAIRWPKATHGGPGLAPFRTAAECIDWSLPCPSIFERAKPLAEKTLWRIAQGVRRFVVESPRPFIVKPNHGKLEPRHYSLDEPLTTITANRSDALVVPTLVQTGYGEREGQAPRSLDLHKPLGTLVNGQKHALVAAFLSKYFGGVVGQQLGIPASTITAIDHHALTSVELEPAPARGSYAAEVRAFLLTYYTGGTVGQSLLNPLRTVTAKDRLGLVTVEGVDYEIADIGLRMLQPRELLRAQFGRFAETYDLSAARTKSDQIRLIGNSVCPEVAEALVRANLPSASLEAAA